jgi:hypothetical protein
MDGHRWGFNGVALVTKTQGERPFSFSIIRLQDKLTGFVRLARDAHVLDDTFIVKGVATTVGGAAGAAPWR